MRLAYLLRENTSFIISILSATIRNSIHPAGNAVQAVGAIHTVNAVRTVEAVHSLSIWLVAIDTWLWRGGERSE